MIQVERHVSAILMLFSRLVRSVVTLDDKNEQVGERGAVRCRGKVRFLRKVMRGSVVRRESDALIGACHAASTLPRSQRSSVDDIWLVVI